MTRHTPNPRFPHHCVITRVVDDDDPMTDDDDRIVVYDGECRSFDFHTTSDAGEVLVSTRKLSLPVRQDEWADASACSHDDRPLIPQEGDIVEVDKGSYREYGEVIDRMPSNLGTHVLWKYGRN